MSVLLERLFLAAFLATAPALAMAQSDDTSKEAAGAETAADGTQSEGEAAEDADGDDAEEDTAELSEDEAWTAKLRQRHHEGDVALGVCGGRMTALMWFYQSSVADGRDDLQPAYEALKESRTVLKNEAERRAIDDGIATSVSVMNEHSTELWEGLLEASETPEDFQEAHDTLFANVQECLTMFFRRAKRTAPAKPTDAEPDAQAEPASGDDAEKAD